ncbi:hypothetical protein [Rhizobium ruizarguesonis]|uniref:hypothetical protein n=1 Tax=Rhizobium ruizarguesonis TaxID=2081791 RepID=UPI00102FA2C0|nr:hypothetical protein [Rhizobium ruizarguesonis]TBD71608.1 hypothetical protein ELH11_38580 [Rhizobium ruizarguesonis]TBD94850.1 hypothetical protein ELH09_38300 [Rhizobium ruizarguesonis]TBE14532.1 hypothetical protein ELH07_38330 [Rhizobium ruizarguesonis]TBE14701.1 hypothetical protein ELH08_38875 [Rhizobium ruizarguesonis]WSH04968.1 hypothetical protein U8P71_34650 [Rhizobium ruizarguesonis]
MSDTDDAIWDWRRILAVAAIAIGPAAIVFCTARLFNEVIEVDRIDFGFLAGTVRYGFSDDVVDRTRQLRFIPSPVVLAIYNFGFAACIMVALSVASTVYATTVIARRFSGLIAVLVFVLVCFAALGVGAAYFSRINLPAAIARELIKGTIYFLPMCERTLAVSCEHSIGNTGNSLLRVVAIIMAIASAAGFSYWAATAAIIAGAGDHDLKRASLKNATLLIATTFLLTVVATHLLFQPGADMIVAAYSADSKSGALTSSGKIALSDYTNLRNAMSLYWGTIFSLAIATAYFPVAIYVETWGKEGGLDNLWNLAKSLVTVISPALASGFLQVAQAFYAVLNGAAK